MKLTISQIESGLREIFPEALILTAYDVLNDEIQGRVDLEGHRLLATWRASDLVKSRADLFAPIFRFKDELMVGAT